MRECCERKHNLSSWAQKVALMYGRINNEVAATVLAITLEVTPPPCGDHRALHFQNRSLTNFLGRRSVIISHYFIYYNRNLT